MTPQDGPVWACIVCFKVPAADLAPLVTALAGQVSRILLLDNSSALPSDIASLASTQVNAQVIYVPMTSNQGTAGAMNAAWQLALAAGAAAMISFDQDSLPSHGMVGLLRASLRALQASGLRPAAIGPGKVDPRNNRTFRLPQSDSSAKSSRPVMPPGLEQVVEVDHLITSGCLISSEMYQSVGPFSSDLFLDYVDIEWSLRARHLGYQLYTDPKATMAHTIGDQVIELWGRSLPVHKPARCYLLVRNHLLLWRLPSVPMAWLLRDLRQVLLKTTLLLALRPQRLQRLVWMLKGLRHGLQKRGGGVPEL